MKHNKYKNIGVIFESLIHYAVKLISEGKTSKASKIMSIIKKNFINKTPISECYSIYSQLLYSEAINYYHASKFYNRLIKEHNKLNHDIINRKISIMFEELKEDFNIKEIMDNKIPNYKLFSSFRIASGQENQYMSSKNSMMVETVILEHLVNNSELKKLSENNIQIISYPKEQQEIDKLALAIAFKNFEKEVSNKLTKEQKECFIKYYSLPTNEFKSWLKNEVNNILNDISDKCLTMENEKVKTKLELYFERLNKINQNLELSSENITDIMLGFELKENLRLI